MDKLARMESLWRDPDYDWVTGEYDDSWGEPPHEEKGVHQYVGEQVEWYEKYVNKGLKKDLTPEDFMFWLYEDNDDIAQYDKEDVLQAVEEEWEE